MNKKNGCVEQLDHLYKEARKTNARICLFIDEYDHFTNYSSKKGCSLRGAQGEQPLTVIASVVYAISICR